VRKHGGGVIGGSRYLAGIEDRNGTWGRKEECRGVQSSVHPGFNRTSGKAEEPAGYSVLSGPHLPTTILTDGPPPLQGGLGTGGTGRQIVLRQLCKAFLDFLMDVLCGSVKIRHNLSVGYPNDLIAKILKVVCPFSVLFFFFRSIVLAAVYLNDQLGFSTAEIYNMIAQNDLTPDPQRISSEKIKPKMPLFPGHVLPHGFGKLPEMGRVMMRRIHKRPPGYILNLLLSFTIPFSHWKGNSNQYLFPQSPSPLGT
jgi:hypothetical protein